MTRRCSFASLASLLSLTAALSLGPIGCSLDGTPGTTTGANGTLEFQYASCLFDDCALESRGIAAGARTAIHVAVKKGYVDVSSAVADDPAVLSVGSRQSSSGSGYEFSVTGGKPGVTTLRVRDAQGAEVDHVEVTVSPVAKIALDAEPDAAGYTVLPGQPFSIHATTLGARGERLAGDGAIHFDFSGAAKADDSFTLCLGDCTQFRLDASADGLLSFSATGSTREVPVHGVDLASIDKLAFTEQTASLGVGAIGSVDYRMTSKGTLVHGGKALTCTSSEPSVATVGESVGTLARDGVSGGLAIHGLKAGNTFVWCSAGAGSSSIVIAVK